MGIVDRMFGQAETRDSTVGWAGLASSLGIGYETASGRNVTALGSLQSTAVFACVRILAESVASLPLILHQRLAGGGKTRADTHNLYDILKNLPNAEMTSVELRETLMGHLALWGNAYSEIIRDNGGRVVGLWPLRPDKVTPTRRNGELVYVIELGIDADRQVLAKNRVMHLKGLGFDGLMGYSPITMARQAIGLALATEEFGSRFFGNGARPGSVLEHPGKLSEAAEKSLRNSWNERHQGLSSAHRVAILEEGMKLHEVGVPPEDAQFLETRKFQVTEIARLYRVPPHMLADLERATFSNIEHQGLEFVQHTLRPWLVRWEQAISRDLLTATERKWLFAEHLIDALLRGDIKSRYEAYSVGRQNGWLSANDVRELENQNPIDGGDMYLVPLNMVPADQLGAQPAPDVARHLPVKAETRARPAQIAASRQRIARSYQRLLSDVQARVTKREAADIKRAARKYFNNRTLGEFKLWLTDFYEGHREFIYKNFLPVMIAYAEQVAGSVEDEIGNAPGAIENFIRAYVESLAAREVGANLGELNNLLESLSDEDPVEVIDERMDHWVETKPPFLGQRESIQSLNAFVLAMYGTVGVTRKQWVATGDTCPYCRDLDGKIYNLNEPFLASGQEFEPEGAERPMKRTHDIGHAPLHDGCDCLIIAA